MDMSQNCPKKRDSIETTSTFFPFFHTRKLHLTLWRIKIFSVLSPIMKKIRIKRELGEQNSNKNYMNSRT